MIVTDTPSHKVSSWNRQTYQRLKLALSLGLRRQLFVAVCDDLSLRNRLAGKLHAELGVTSAKASVDSQDYLKLVSLNLNLSDPNPLAQIAQWLAQNRQSRSPAPAPGFQILGVERLTRQPPAAQRLFLRRLQAIDRYLPRLESTLLLWLPRPWFHTIQQSVPEFWQWHTAVFEFEGEPTPPPPVGSSKPEASRTSSAVEDVTGSFKEDLRSLLANDLGGLQVSKLKVEGSQTFKIKGLNVESDAPLSNQSSNSPPATQSNPQPSDLQTDTPIPNPQSEEEELEISKLTVVSDSDAVATLGGSTGLSSGLENTLQPSTQNEPLERSEENLQPSTHNEQPSVSPADAYLKLGHYYRHTIEQGDASEENLAIAIQAYEQALQWLENDSSQVADVLNDIGNLYWMLSRCPTSTEHTLSYLEQAIQAYQLALTKLTAEDAPHTYAMIQNNLGAAYGDLARHKEPTESLEQSIRAYEEALRYRRADSEPMKYASTQNNLGTAHWNLAQHHSPVPNLRAAIAAYAEALCYYSTQSEPLNWAMIQNNLGTAYWNLAQYEQPETWLQLAIVAYQDALTYRTPDVAPAACAATQNNLGTAYWHLADRFQDDSERRAEYLYNCIAAYESALALAGRQPFTDSQQLSHNNPQIPVNFDVFATHNNLGLAHYQLATEAQFSLDKASKSAHLEAALHQHVQACTGVSPQSDSYQTSLSYLIKTIRAIYREGGLAGQNLALAKVPGQLLPEILPRL